MNNFFFYEDSNFLLILLKFLQGREQTNSEVVESVRRVINDVKVNKDSAVLKYTKKFDNVNPRVRAYFISRLKLEKV